MLEVAASTVTRGASQAGSSRRSSKQKSMLCATPDWPTIERIAAQRYGRALTQECRARKKREVAGLRAAAAGLLPKPAEAR
jgi:hypothetical protein